MPVIELNSSSFDSEVLQSDIPVLVDFWSPTCVPCRALVPVLNSLDENNDGDVKIAKVNVFDCPDIAQRYGVSSLPSLIFFKGGTVAEKMLGVQSQEKLQNVLDELTE